MWEQVRKLRESGVTIILTTHYIEEAEEMADRVGVISKGKLILTENTQELMRKMGKKNLILELEEPITQIPDSLQSFDLKVSASGKEMTFVYDTRAQDNRVADLLDRLKDSGVKCWDLHTEESSLEDIFIELVTQ